MNITNLKVYDLRESIIACRNSMRIVAPDYSDKEFEESLKRAIKLCKCKPGTGESNFRVGIRVSFDLHYPNYISPEMQRYHWFDIVNSASKMHRIMQMDFDYCCNKWVTEKTIKQMKELIQAYKEEKSEDNFMRVISNCPQGIMLFMRISTNYEQLATIYRQRKSHRLPEWRWLCKEWIPTLPYAKELIMGEE